MTDVRIAARLALAAGPTRTTLIAAGYVIGVAVLLLATAVPNAAFGGDDGTAGDRRIGIALSLVLALPVTVLLASVTRLSAAVRDRRLASLRLLGVDAGRTARIAGLEALLLAVFSVLVGVLIYVMAISPAVRALDAGWRQWFEGRPLDPPNVGWAAALLGVPLLSVLVSLAPVRAVARTPIAIRREAPTVRPGWWRLLPFATGIVLLTLLVAQPNPAGSRITQIQIALLLGGVVLLTIALPLVVPLLVRLAADGAARSTRSVPWLIAARRLQQQPAATTRLVAVLLVGLFLLAAGLSALTPFERSAQYLRALRASTAGPQRVDVIVDPSATIDATRVRAIPGVLALVPRRPVGRACTPQEQNGAVAAVCGSVFIGTCAELTAFSSGITGCRDDQPAWLQPEQTKHDEQPRTTRLIVDPDDQEAGALAGRSTQIAVPGFIDVRFNSDDPAWNPGVTLFVPTATPGITGLLAAPHQWQAALVGGAAPTAALIAAVGPAGRILTEDTSELNTVGGYRAVLYAVTVIVLAICLVGLLITGIDHAVERRRHLAALTLIGVQPAVVRRSQLLQALTPLIVGVPLAGCGGLLTGAAYLALIGQSTTTPWPAVSAVTAAALAAAFLVATATVAGLGGRIKPVDFRRE